MDHLFVSERDTIHVGIKYSGSRICTLVPGLSLKDLSEQITTWQLTGR